MPYLAGLHDICGNAFEPLFCLIAFFLLVSLGGWSVLGIARDHRRAETASAVVFGVVLVAAVIPGVVFSEVWITCSLSDSASPSVSLAPAMAFRNAPVTPGFRFI